jgi:RNA polymerase sigma-70 factor, ECF subfamily
MARLVAGDREALGLLMERHQRRLYRLALGYLRNPEDALDVVQETFVRVYIHAARWKESYEVSAWLTRIAINQAIDRYRREKRRRQTMTPLDETLPVPAPAGSSSPERSLGRREMQENLTSALDALSDKQRAVFLLRHREELPLEEIGRTLGLNLGTVKSTLHRALARLRQRLGEVRTC